MICGWWSIVNAKMLPFDDELHFSPATGLNKKQNRIGFSILNHKIVVNFGTDAA